MTIKEIILLLQIYDTIYIEQSKVTLDTNVSLQVNNLLNNEMINVINDKIEITLYGISIVEEIRKAVI